MIAGILAVVVIVVLIIQVKYYKDKSDTLQAHIDLMEYSHTELYPEEVSSNVRPVMKVSSVAGMGYGEAITIIDDTGRTVHGYVGDAVKLNKDGSIAKKRGRKPRIIDTTGLS